MTRRLALIALLLSTACPSPSEGGDPQEDAVNPCDDQATCFDTNLSVCDDQIFAIGGDGVLVNCADWGAACVGGSGCVLPRGASCIASAPCEATGGAQVCIEGTCPLDDADDHLEFQGATPVLLPSTTAVSLIAGDLDCITVTPPQRGVLEVQHDGQAAWKVNQQGTRRDAPINGTATHEFVAVEAAPVTLCAVNHALVPTEVRTATITLAMAGFDDVDTVCLDDTTLRTPTEDLVCAAGMRCSHRAGSPACRGLPGEACDTGADDCLGVCRRTQDGASACVDGNPDTVVDLQACRDNEFFLGDYEGYVIQAIDVCGDSACVAGRGCVREAEDVCFERQWCAVADGTFTPCDGGQCP